MDIAFLNGEFIPQSELKIPVYDTGFMLGATIAEQVRTFNRQPFWLSRHLARLESGLHRLKITMPVQLRRLNDIVREIIERNGSHVVGQDLGVTIFVTPGAYPSYGKTNEQTPTIAVHSRDLPFRLWCERYKTGHQGIIAESRQVPQNCWPSDLKCRSRMHYFLASQEALDKSATAILLDQDGNVSESPIANIIAHFPNEGLVSPPLSDILPGVSLEYIRQLSQRLDIRFTFRKIEAIELTDASEVFLTSTPFCIQSLVEVDNQRIGDGQPGPVYHELIRNWSNDVGLDIVQQAEFLS